ncbi:TPA: hypothetical protein ACH3X1_002285 [Trebouxia sp. C0004]
MLGAVQSLYDGSLPVYEGQCGHSQSPSIGLRQGCPLSATLFGIFVDGLHHHLQTTAPAAGVQIRHLRLTDLVYADDICLLAGGPQLEGNTYKLSLLPWLAIVPRYTWRSVWQRQK